MKNDIGKLNKQRLALLSVCSPYDKELLENKEPSKYEVRFQAGAYYEEARVSDYNDYDGTDDQISELNRRLCEFTVWYYAWKHLESEYIGICHYRRKYDISDEQLDYYMDNNYDAITCHPILVEPSIEESYKMYHHSYDWDVMMDILKEYNSDYYEKALDYFSKNVFYSACMYIYKREIFVKASEFVFPLLLEFCKRRPEKKEMYQRREAAFLGERLLALFYVCNKDSWVFEEVPRIHLETVESQPNSVDFSSKEAINAALTNAMARNDMINYSKLVNRIDSKELNSYVSSYLIMHIYKKEKELLAETLHEYLPFSNDYDFMSKFFTYVYSSIQNFLVEQNSDTFEKINQLISNYHVSPVAFYEIMSVLGWCSEDNYFKFLSFFFVNKQNNYFEYYLNKAIEDFPDSPKITYFLTKEI